MQVSSKGTSVSRRWAQNLYLTWAGLIQLGILVQGFLIGAYLFGGASWGRDGHGIVGLVLLAMSLLLPLIGLLAKLPGSMIGLSFLLFVLVIIQMILGSIGGNVPLLAALHPANAMILFGLNLVLIFQIRQLMRAGE
ncbi:MAG TPA: DUF6220 domain-containing protein [Ktedonobacteraceae bacterium]